jgi:hypothetical protein
MPCTRLIIVSHLLRLRNVLEVIADSRVPLPVDMNGSIAVLLVRSHVVVSNLISACAKRLFSYHSRHPHFAAPI